MLPFVKTKWYFFKQMMKIEYFLHSRNITGVCLIARMTTYPLALENILYNTVESDFVPVGDFLAKAAAICTVLFFKIII